MTPEEAKRLDHFFCEGCSSEGQKKLQNSHNASRHSDTKVQSHLLKVEYILQYVFHFHVKCGMKIRNHLRIHCIIKCFWAMSTLDF